VVEAARHHVAGESQATECHHTSPITAARGGAQKRCCVHRRCIHSLGGSLVPFRARPHPVIRALAERAGAARGFSATISAVNPRFRVSVFFYGGRRHRHLLRLWHLLARMPARRSLRHESARDQAWSAVICRLGAVYITHGTKRLYSAAHTIWKQLGRAD